MCLFHRVCGCLFSFFVMVSPQAPTAFLKSAGKSFFSIVRSEPSLSLRSPPCTALPCGLIHATEWLSLPAVLLDLVSPSWDPGAFTFLKRACDLRFLPYTLHSESGIGLRELLSSDLPPSSTCVSAIWLSQGQLVSLPASWLWPLNFLTLIEIFISRAHGILAAL